MVKIRVHVFVSGKVQGVFFRQSTEMQAQGLGVKGWARNLSDGRVEAVFEGEQDVVNKLVDYCRRGPSAARVERLEVLEEDFNGEYSAFETC